MRRVVCAVSALVLLAGWTADVSAAETRIGPKGQVFVDGKATVPLGVWIQPPYLFSYHRQLGLNLLINPHVERGQFRDKKPTVFPTAAENRLGIVLDFRDSAIAESTVWAWDGGLMLPGRMDRIKSNFERIRANDPSRIIMFNIDIRRFLHGENGQFYQDALPCSDAVVSHVWPQVDGLDKSNIRNVAIFVDLVRQYCKNRPGGEVSIWPDINPHEWRLKKRTGGTLFPAPSQEELRFQIWLALIHGADGICFFPISFDPFVYCQIPAKKEQEIAWNSQLIERLTPVLTGEESPLEISVASDRDGGIIDFTTRRLGDDHYVFLVNGQREEQTVSLRAAGLGKQWSLGDVISGKPIAVGGDTYEEKLKGLELRIWKLTATEKPESDKADNQTREPGGKQAPAETHMADKAGTVRE